jgi:hypothetical protein
MHGQGYRGLQACGPSNLASQIYHRPAPTFSRDETKHVVKNPPPGKRPSS